MYMKKTYTVGQEKYSPAGAFLKKFQCIYQH